MSETTALLRMLGLNPDGLVRAVVRIRPGAPIEVTAIYADTGADGVPEERRRRLTVDKVKERDDVPGRP